MAQVGTGGQTNVTQNSAGNQGLDISAIGNINADTSLTDIAGAYTGVGKQFNEMAISAAKDVGRRQTELIGNDFGAVNAYNYDQYYNPASTSFQSMMRTEGTQHALEVGMDRAKKDAEEKARAAQQNYANAQSTLENLEEARRNVVLAEAGEIGGGTSGQELLKFAETSNAENADELYRDVSARYLSDQLVGTGDNWNIKEYREKAKAETLAQFGLTPEQYDKMSEDERQAFWDKGDVGAFWTNRYAYEYAKNKYGEQVANDYQDAYRYNYNVVRKMFDYIKAGSDALSECAAFIMVAKVETQDVIKPSKVSYSTHNDVVTVGETRYNFKDTEEARNGEKDHAGNTSIYSIVTEEEAKEIRTLVKDVKNKDRSKSYVPGIKETDERELEKAQDKLERYIANAVAKSPKAEQDVVDMRKISFEKDYHSVENLIEGAFGADYQSINYLMKMRENNPQQYEDLIHDYALVATYGQVFEVADGKTTYHTAEGDKVLEEGTYVMYTLPGFQNADGTFNEPNLKRYMELRSEEFSADMSEEDLEAEMNKCLEGYQRVVTAALFLAAGSDCDTNSDIVHAAIYAANPSNQDSKNVTIYGGHTAGEIIEKFAELADKEGEKAYSLFTKIVKQASSVSGSMMAKYGNQLTTVSTQDAVGRDMIGSEINAHKNANTLFTDGDIDNLTVEEATALWTVLATSIDEYNNGNQNGNIKSDFLTADGLDWFKLTGIELVKGVVGIVDLVGNLVWTGTSAFATQIGTLVEGRGGNWTQEEYDRVFKDGRWWGWGGTTGNWTGQASFYDQFIGDYKETAFGYGEENQWRMTNNLTHLVNPIMRDMWFGEEDDVDALGVGRTGDEGMNYRSAMKMTSNLAGLVGAVVTGNYIAKGVGAAAQWAGKLSKSAASAAAKGIKGRFMGSALRRGASNVSQMFDDAATVASGIATNPADDVTRVLLGMSDEAAGLADDAANLADDVANASDDVLDTMGSQNIPDASNYDELMKQQSRITAGKATDVIDDAANRATEMVGKGFASAEDDAVKALGAISTSNVSSEIVDDIVAYSEKLFRKMTGLKTTDQTYKELMNYFSKRITKEAFNTAHLSAYSGMSVDDIVNIGAESRGLLSALAHTQSGGYTAGMPKDLIDYLRGMSKDTLNATLREISERASLRAAVNKVWTQDDTIRALARSGWDSKRLSLLTKDWLRNQLQDLSTDMLYGYIKPTVTNEGTDRETIDEYLTNPWNYAFNFGAAGIQYVGGRVLNKMGQAVTANSLDKARRALAIAEDAGDSTAIVKKTRKVMKLVDRANKLADKALERGKTLEDVKELTDAANAYADDAIRAVQENTIRNMTDEQIRAFAKDMPGLSEAIQKEDMGMLRNLFFGYNAGTVKAHANYFQFKRMLNTYNGGLGSVMDVKTNGIIWQSLFDGRYEVLRKMNIDRGSVTISDQKKIYKAMVDKVMDSPIAKTIPGLRNSLNNYFDTLISMAEAGGYKRMRAGYLPIESMLNNNETVSAGLRGFSSGEFVLHSATANPYLERSIGLRDRDVVDAILKGEKEIKLKDEDGNFIVDAAGEVQTRELNPNGLNFLDSITNASNAKTFHDYIDPVIGANGSQAGSQGLKNAYIIVKQKGALDAAVKKSVAYNKKVMDSIENEVFNTVAAKTENTKAKNAAKVKLQAVGDENPRLKKAMAASEAVKVNAENKIEALTARKNTITQRQQEFPAALMNYINDAGRIDTKAGFEVFNRYKEIIKKDLAKFRNGEINVGDTISTPMYRFDRFAWQYSRDNLFGTAVDGFSHDVPVDATYYALLQNCVNENLVDPPKDMVMTRMLMTQEVAPTNKSGAIWKSVNDKTGDAYPWQSPLQFFRSSFVTDDTASNIALRNYQNREIEGWTYKSTEKGKPWTAAQFDSLMLDTPENIRIAKDIVAKNLGGKTLPVDSNGKLTKTAKNMLDVATNNIIVTAKGSSKSGSINIGFAEYVDNLSTLLAEQGLFAGAFNKKSGYYDIFRKLNSYENTGGTFAEFNTYILDRISEAKINGEDFTDLAYAYALWNEIEAHNHRAIGLGENFDAGMTNDSDYNVLFNSSKEAIDANNARTDLNPEQFARRNEIIEKGIAASKATDEELELFGISKYAPRASDKEMQKVLSLLDDVTADPEHLETRLKSLNKVFDEYMSGDRFSEKYNQRVKLLKDLTQLIDEDTTALINRAKRATAVSKRIERYAESRKHRQKAYGVEYEANDSKYDALKAFGATDTNSGYTNTKNPAQYRAVKSNLDIYDANFDELDALKREFDSAVMNYREGLRRQLSDTEIKRLQGAVDEARKRFAQTATDKGIDLTGAYTHNADWSGQALDYDRMMLVGGSLGGKVQQAIDALEEVKGLLIVDGNPMASKLIDDIDAKIRQLDDVRVNRIPDYEDFSFKQAKGSSVSDSFEMGLAFTMSDTIYGEGLEQSSRYMINPDGTRTIVETKPTNRMFTDEQLNAIGISTRGSDRTGSGRHRLTLDDSGNIIRAIPEDYDLGRTTFEFNGDNNATVEFTNIGVDDNGPIGMTVEANGDFVDLANLTPEKILEINEKNFYKKSSPYRLAIIDDASSANIEKPLTKAFTYGDKQPEFDRLNAASKKANAIYEYKQLEAKTPNRPNADELEFYDRAKQNPMASVRPAYDEHMSELAKLKKKNKLTDSDIDVSLEDAQTNAWMANAELDRFTKANKQTIQDVSGKPTNIDEQIADLKVKESEAVEKVAEAREFGDLSENEEYRSARRELAQIRNELAELEATKSGKNISNAPKKPELSDAERDLVVSSADVESIGETYGKYTFVKMASDNFTDDTAREFVADASDNLAYNRDAAYTEWLAFSKDESDIQDQIDKLMKEAKNASDKADKTIKKDAKTKVADPDDATKKVTYEDLSEKSFEGKLKEKATPEQYAAWKKAKDNLDYARSIKKDSGIKSFRDHNGVLYLADDAPNLANYATYENQLTSRGWKPLKKGQEVPPVDPKADKAARKEMQKAITKNRHAGDVFDSRVQDWQVPKDKKGNILFDASSKNSTIANMEEIYRQVREYTGMDLDRSGILMNNEYADLLTRITDESVEAGKLRKTIGAVSNFAQAIQNIQLAGGASWVNALSIAQLRGAIFQNPMAMKEYLSIVGSMRNSAAVSMFAQDSLPLLSKFVLEIGDASILNDFGAAISTRPGISDGGVLQNMTTNLFNIKKDFVKARIDNDGSIPKAFKDVLAKDIQNTIFEDATFRNAMPVLRAKMLTANYDAAMNRLSRKFPNMDGKLMEKAAIQMAYAKTESFFNPYKTIGKTKVSDVLDTTFTKNVRDFAASFTNSKSQTTILDTLTSFFFALRYKMMLSGRVYAGAAGAIPTIKGKMASRAIADGGASITKESLNNVVDTMGTAFMHSGSLAGIGSLGTLAVIAAANATALGIPTAWDDVSWIDEYDGSFKIPDILLKFQTIGQIWLPNAYSEERGSYVDPTKPMYGLDTMSSIFTLQNSLFRTIDRSVNPETYYAAPQRGIIGSASSSDVINQLLNAPVPRAIGDELLGSNLLSPFKAVYEVVMDSTYFGNNIWEKRKLPDGKDNPNYDFGRNVAASTMHILGLDQVLDGGKGYNGWVKGQGKPGYVEQDQIGTVKGSGILQHEFYSAAVDMMEGKYIEAIYGAGELPVKVTNLSSKARTEFNTRVKNIVAGYNDEYKAVTSDVNSTADDKDAAFKEYAKKAAGAVSTWSKKHDYALGQDQKLVPYVTRTLMAMVSGEYDDNMYYVQDAYWKASDIAQIEGVTGSNWWLDDEDLKQWIADGKTAEEFAEEKNRRAAAYNKAQDDEYDAREALIEANIDNDGNEMIKGLKDFLTNKYSYNDLKAEQRAVNKEIFTSIHAKLDMPVGEFDNFKEMKAYYEKMIEGSTSKNQKVNLAMRYNTYVFDLLAPYAEKYGANIVSDGYYNGKGLANDLAEYIILPADKKYYGKTPVANYIKDVFNVGYRNGAALPSDAEIYEKFITAQNLMMKGAVSSSLSVLDSLLLKIKKGQAYVSDSDYNRIINMRAILSARSK